MNPKAHDARNKVSVFVWVAIATSLILLVPLIAMQFTSEVNWGAADFIVMGVLLFGGSSLFVLVTRRSSRRQRFAIAIVFAAVFIFVWAELAVGVFTNLGS